MICSLYNSVFVDAKKILLFHDSLVRSMKKIFSGFCILILILLSISWSVLFFPSVIAPGVSHDVYGGSIQQAIIDSNPGDIIIVHDGTYNENIIINKNLTLRGSNREAVIIDGEGLPGNVVTISANNVTFERFTVKNSNYQGIRIIGNNTSINDCIITNTDIGILCTTKTHDNIINNTICRDNNESTTKTGIYIDSLSYNTIISNVTCLYNSGWGIRLNSANLSTVSDTILNHNGDGVNVYYSSNNTIMNTTCENNTNSGIHLWESSQNIIKNSVFWNNNIGIECDAGSYNAFNNITCKYNNMGFSITQSSNQTLTNIICNNNTDGIYFESGSIDYHDNNIINNVICNNNTQNGICLWNSYSIVSNATCWNNTRGILSALPNNAIINSDIRYNKEGIYLLSSNYTSIINCTIVSNIKIGINLSDTGWSTITNNNISDSSVEIKVNHSLWPSLNNKIYHNKFFSTEKTENPVSGADASFQQWSLPYPVGGNYWNTYTTSHDNNSGEHQDVQIPDLICDQQYTLLFASHPSLIDYYPFIKPDGWYQPHDPTPAYNAIHLSLTPTLSWMIGNLGVGVTFNVSFGTSFPLTNVSINQSEQYYNPAEHLDHLAFQTKYYWRVVAHNANGDIPSPLWMFTTRDRPFIPEEPPSMGDTHPVISNIVRTPTVVSNNDLVTISATVTDDHRVDSVLLNWTDGSPHSQSMSETIDDQYTSTFGPFRALSTITYWITAEDDASQISRSVNYSFTVRDRTGPTIQIISPLPGTTLYNSTPIIVASYEDPGGINITTAFLSLDDIPVTPNATITPKRIIYRSTPLREGSHTIVFSIADTFGNIAWKNWSFHLVQNLMVTQKSLGNISAEDLIEIPMEHVSETGVSEVTFQLTEPYSNVELILVVLPQKPIEITQDPQYSGIVYHYLDITLTSDDLPVADTSIRSMTITFTVLQSWVNEHTIDKNTIHLARYHNGNWHNLTTTLLNENTTMLRYQAQIPGLSTFAVVGSQVIEVNPYQEHLPEIPWIVIIGIVVIASILLIALLFKAGYIYREDKQTDEQSQKSSRDELPKEPKP